MNRIFDPVYAKEIMNRIDRLKPDAQPLWGEMNAAQMLAHCSMFQDVATGKITTPRTGLGMIVGRFAKPIFYNDKPLPRNMSTIPAIAIKDWRSFSNEKEILKQKIIEIQHINVEKHPLQPHPFFGRLTVEEWGKGLYKHLDHHLKQFGVE